MDNIQFWLYVIVAVIYLISAARKKSKKQNQPEDFPEATSRPAPREYEEPASQRPKPITFEELLREITEAKEPQSAPVESERRTEYSHPTPQPEYVDYDDDIEDEEKSLEDVTAIDEERTTKIYEEAKKLAFYRPSLEETLKVQDVNTTYGKFAAFEAKQEPNLLLDYTKDLRDPKGFKKALILSEILNRKHF
jgi:hypothetical protein